MKRPVASLLCSVLAGSCVLAASPRSAASVVVPENSAVHSNNALAIDLYQQFVGSDDSGDNVFFSPLSVSTALMLAYEGAGGQTQAEFEQVLHLPGKGTQKHAGKDVYHAAWGGVLGRLNEEGKPYTLTTANGLWGEKTMPFRAGFVQALDTHYDAGLESVDFVGDSEGQRKQINAWVSQRTHDRINDLLPAGSLDARTRLVLVNAVYFKAQWAKTFSEHATQEAAFYRLPGEDGEKVQPVEVPLMHHREARFSYGDFEGYDALELPYRGGDLSMLVLLPDEADGLAGLEARLDAGLIDATLKGMELVATNVWLPKWEMTQDYDLIPALKALGMADAFDAHKADFSGISDSAQSEGLAISGVFHKAFIAVDEQGTEAAAATGIVVGTLSLPLPPDRVVEFRADHPFVYVIRDNKSGAILFMGRVTDPS